MSVHHPWYSDPSIQRDRSHVLGSNEDDSNSANDNNKFVIITAGRKMLHQEVQGEKSSTTIREPTYLSLDAVNKSVLSSCPIADVKKTRNNEMIKLLAWIGNYENVDFWVIHLNKDKNNDMGDKDAQEKTQQDNIIQSLCDYQKSETTIKYKFSPLREFGDSLESTVDAGLLATANGLMEFHRSHAYCSVCGSTTTSDKAGACRRCTACRKSSYPRLDVAAIMLITDANNEFALLGRKRNWPKGRYSTLAGFTEVGETIEQCCIRETHEESGVRVDPMSLRFVASQPWPFPQSLMVGFQAKALPVEKKNKITAATSESIITQQEPRDGNLPVLPEIVVDTDEMEDIRWFHRNYVKARLGGGSTALEYKPDDTEKEFHIPGRASLARVLITEWCNHE